MGITANQPPVQIGPGLSHSQELAFINDNFIHLNNQLQTFGYSDSVTVSREASSDSAYADVETGILNAPVFIVFATAPGSSPAFRFALPKINYDITTGVVEGGLRALYDPTTGVIRCFVESSVIGPSYGTPETWIFTFYLVKPTV